MDPTEIDYRSDRSSSTRRRQGSPYEPHNPQQSYSTEPSRNLPNLAPPARQRAVSAYDSLPSPIHLQPNSLNSRHRDRAASPAETHRPRSTSQASQGGTHYQPFPVDKAADWPEAAELVRNRKATKSLLSERSIRTDRTGESDRRRRKSTRSGLDDRLWSDSASESGYSLLSAFGRQPGRDKRSEHHAKLAAEERAQAKRATDSPLRKVAKWLHQHNSSRAALWIGIGLVLIIRYSVGLGGYSGRANPPLRGDLEAQRHWLALTSSSLNNIPFLHRPPSPSYNATIPLSSWYFHDLSYWGLDYPPLTAYHSLLLGAVARLSPRTAEYVTLRPPTYAEPAAIAAWEHNFARIEAEGEMKSWLRGTVVVGDLLVWVSAVVVFCRRNYETGKGEKGARVAWVGMMSILLQPGLILIDSGHFQYNSLMLGLTLWSVNLFQAGHDLLGAVAFVASLGFKQMALYYSPGIFAYLLGKCFYLGPSAGLRHLIHIGLATVIAFALLFAPFLASGLPVFLQSIHRIFPFARGLFEDKVANVWCALNVVVKLRDLATVASLAKLALVATLLAVLPGIIGLVWVSWEAGKRKRAEDKAVARKAGAAVDAEAEAAPPTAMLLPHALFTSSMAFFLFSFQVHEKSILLPLMPLTLLIGGREAGFGRLDWEWAVLLNNVATFSMWPLLKKDGLGLEYAVLTVLWNWAVGYNPFALKNSFVKVLSIASCAVMLGLHLLELVATPPAHLPDIFVVLNVTFSVAVFGLSFLWATKRSAQEGWAVVGMK